MSTPSDAVLQRICRLSNDLGEPSWVVLPPFHEDHEHNATAIMGAECEIVKVYGRDDRDRRERAAGLVELLNLTCDLHPAPYAPVTP